MSWAVGGPDQHGRFIGYGVPAICEEPACDSNIDRGIDCACGGGVMEDVPNCGLFFCSSHLYYTEDGPRQGWVCSRCLHGQSSFAPKPDTAEWRNFMLTDDSWRQWRAENPERVKSLGGVA